jgi:phage baseplate assembly protein gpV
MRHEVNRDLTWSARMFRDVVWPEIKVCCRGGELIPVEGVTDDYMANLFDQKAGVDAWQVTDKGIRGIASRVQNARAYASFTVRKTRTSGATTEWEKRVNILNDNCKSWIWPSLTVQAYVIKERFQYAAIVDTADLYRNAQEAQKGITWQLRTNGDDGNTFAVFWVDWLKNNGVKVREFGTPDITAPKQREAVHA